MSWFRVFTVAVVLLVWASPRKTTPAFRVVSQTSLSAQATNFTLEGKITAHAPGKITVSTEENILFHVRYDHKTEIKRLDGTPGSAKDFRVDVKVKVEGELTESGEINAQKIELQRDSASGRR